MTESTTLYCKAPCDNAGSIRKRLGLLNPTEIIGELDSNWTKIKCVTNLGNVQFARQFFVAQADYFTKLRWKTIVKVQAKAETNPDAASKVESHLTVTEAIIGIVADPGFDQIDKLPELIGFLAMEFDALIFNGSDFMDYRGNTIFSV